MSEASQSHDLRNRIFFTLFILSVYRFGTFVPIPGIDPEQLQIMMEGNQKGLLGMFNVFAGGAVSRMAIFALGIMPYISSSIIVQLLTGVSDYRRAQWPDLPSPAPGHDRRRDPQPFAPPRDGANRIGRPV